MTENEQSNESDDNSDIFRIVSQYGPWQRTVFVVLFYINIIEIWHSFAITFLAPNVVFWCVSNQNNDTVKSFFNDTNPRAIPRNNSLTESNDHCSFTFSPNSTFQNISTQKTAVENFSSKIPCTKWSYNVTSYSNTIITEWDLVCDRKWLVSEAKSIYMVGFMISSLTLGQISDWIGRWLTLMICYIITFVSGLFAAFSNSYIMFIVSRFFQAFGTSGLSITGYVLLMEIINFSRRTSIGISVQYGFSVGLITLPVIAWFIRHWFWLQLTISLSVLPVAIVYWLIPESPRWLLTQKKWSKLEKVLMEAARKNEKDVRIDISKISSEHLTTERKIKAASILDLFRTSKLRKRTFSMAYLWTVSSFVCYGISYNTNDLWGDPFVNVLILGLMEFPAYFISFFGSQHLGRRLTVTITMLIAGTACAAIILIPDDLPWLITLLSLTGNFCITSTFGVLFLYTTELFPTVIRNVAAGVCSSSARIGSIFAPFVRELGQFTHASVPSAVFAVLSISGGFLVCLLPETRNKKILDTLDEVEYSEEEKNNENHFSLWTISKENSEDKKDNDSQQTS